MNKAREPVELPKRQSESTSSRCTRFLAAVFRVGCFCAFLCRYRLLLLRDSDGFAERILRLRLATAHSRKKYASEPEQLGIVPALLISFD